MNVFCYDGLGIVSNNAADPDPHHFPFLLVLYVKIIKIDINQNSIFRIIFLKRITRRRITRMIKVKEETINKIIKKVP